MVANRTRRRKLGFISSKLSKKELLELVKDEKRINKSLTKEKIETIEVPKFIKSL